MPELPSDDPWTHWYAAYRVMRAARRAELARRKAANRLTGVLLGSMLAGGAAAGLAVKLVLAN